MHPLLMDEPSIEKGVVLYEMYSTEKETGSFSGAYRSPASGGEPGNGQHKSSCPLLRAL
jgi:hypothetical protein